MLVFNVYSVRDLKAETYSQPFFSPNDGTAMRAFSDGLRDPQTVMARHPEDYALFRVGVWNTDNGAIAGTDVPIPVISGVEAMRMGRTREWIEPTGVHSQVKETVNVPGE